MKMSEGPLVTVITVVYNGINTIEETIQSVINQSYSKIEYIIIDGASNDGTLEIVKKYENKIDLLISEPDKGIFDAMNKGLTKVNGEWVIFMNAGDMFYDVNVITNTFKENVSNIDMLYGDVSLYDESDTYFFRSKTNKIKINLNAVCHQSVFLRAKLHPPFLLDFKLSADHEIIYNFVKKGNIKYLDFCISRILIGGVSSNLKDTRIEKFKVTFKNGNYFDFFLGCFFYLYGASKDYSKRLILTILPLKYFYKLREMKNRIEEK